ncbi:hypothetical protein ACS0TY_005419 [Phlomoides rotata]
MKLLDDDKEYMDDILEVSFWASTHYVINLFIILLISSSMISPKKCFWRNMKSYVRRYTLSTKTFVEFARLTSILSFGGKSVVLGGDFRQILLVIPKDLHINDKELKNHALMEIEKLHRINESTLHTFSSIPIPGHALISKEILNVASSGITSLLLPEGCTTHSRFTLPININELSTCQIKPETVGDGRNLGNSQDKFVEIEVPEENLIIDVEDLVLAIVDNIYPSISDKLCTHNYFKDITILAPTQKEVGCINEIELLMILGDVRECLSFDSLCKAEYRSGGNGELSSIYFLNSIKTPGLPNHSLVLKIGVSIMLLRNID